MLRLTKLTGISLAVGALAACSATAPSGPHAEEYWMPHAEGVALVQFLNDADVATYDLLDDQCAIRSDAARAIVLRRADGPFETAAEVEAVHGVGPVTMELLVGCAADLGYVPSQADLEVLAFLNDRHRTDLERLDEDCGLRRDTAEQVLRHRDGKDGVPGTWDDNLFDDVRELSGVYGMGDETLDQLRDCAGWFQSL